MKKVKVKEYQLTLQQGKDRASTINLIEYCMDIIPQGGYTPKNLREYNRLQKVLDKCKEDLKITKKEQVIQLHFEDEDVRVLKTIVENSKWGARNENILDFTEAIKNM